MNLAKIVNFADMLGHTIVEVNSADSDVVVFQMENGQECRLYHEQDCCESVSVESVNGTYDDLIGSPLTFVDEETSNENPPDTDKPTYQDDSFTWTTYTLTTAKGTVRIRWYGESNGYYSEDVYFAVR